MTYVKKSLLQSLGVRLLRLSSHTGLILGSSILRLVVLTVAFGVVCVLTYKLAWSPLRQPFDLPAGIMKEDPELDASVLQQINSQRAERAAWKGDFAAVINILRLGNP